MGFWGKVEEKQLDVVVEKEVFDQKLSTQQHLAELFPERTPSAIANKLKARRKMYGMVVEDGEVIEWGNGKRKEKRKRERPPKNPEEHAKKKDEGFFFFFFFSLFFFFFFFFF